MDFFNRILSFFISLFLMFSSLFSNVFSINKYEFEIDAANLGKTVGNLASTVNIWSIEDGQFVNPKSNKENNIFDFVEYVQFMQCTGGTEGRDLFQDPLNKAVLDDYNFTPLIENCKGVLSLGAKPFLKLGSVPLKFSKNSTTSTEFGVNPYPPDDYDVYYNYIFAIITSLVEEFGLEEVRSWRFGVMTEYENQSWFMADGGEENLAERSAIEYFKLYDYTVQALIDVLGEDIFVGAHSMTVTEGLWDELLFIEHCANGTNYKTGKKGSKISYLAASFYDVKPGKYTSGKTLPETINYLKNKANEVGLRDLIFGIDEGRLLYGVNRGADENALISRCVGNLYQASYDARMYTQMIRNDINYFSHWGYLSGGLLKGNPTVSYHVSKHIADFEGGKLAHTEKTKSSALSKSEVDSVAVYNPETKTMHVMAYNFNNSLNYKKSINLNLKLSAPQFADKKVRITSYTIDDNCNYFDEWLEDRKTYGIDNSCFGWSPDDPEIESGSTLKDEKAREIYFSKLYEKYKECSKLLPQTEEVVLSGNQFTLQKKLAPHSVIFYDIALAE